MNLILVVANSVSPTAENAMNTFAAEAVIDGQSFRAALATRSAGGRLSGHGRGSRGHLLEIGWARVRKTITHANACLIALPDGQIPPAVARITGVSERMM